MLISGIILKYKDNDCLHLLFAGDKKETEVSGWQRSNEMDQVGYHTKYSESSNGFDLTLRSKDSRYTNMRRSKELRCMTA